MTASVTELPLNTFLGLQRGASGAELLRLPVFPDYLNHLGAVHASAQMALAEASSGEFLHRHLASADGLVPVVRRLHAKFREPDHGAVSSAAIISPTAGLPRVNSGVMWYF